VCALFKTINYMNDIFGSPKNMELVGCMVLGKVRDAMVNLGMCRLGVASV
jgi:hypothetical protein